jgi:AIPR protein
MSNAGANAQLTDAELERLKAVLLADYVPHLPPLLPNTQTKENNDKKQLSRAFSAFALSAICNITPVEAGASVVDDFDDGGVDAFFLSQKDKRLYFVQGKLKKGEQFQEAEALKFVAGVQKIVSADLAALNNHVQKRIPSVEDELDFCRDICLIVAHVGDGVSVHAKTAIAKLTEDKDQDETRFEHPYLDFGPSATRIALSDGMARTKINKTLRLLSCRQISQPRQTYIGLIKLDDLVAIHEEFGDALFDRNLRNPLSDRTDVNRSIYSSLEQKRDEFFYLNNGITALADKIESKTAKNDNSRKIDVRGLSIVNGAQSISTATRFKNANPTVNTEDVKVTITVISAGADSDFGKAVTRARNHQNAVFATDFAALEDEQERLRRELKARGIIYAYKAQDLDPTGAAPTITIVEAAYGLALLDSHPRNPWFLRTNQDAFRTPGDAEYQRIFPNGVSSEKVLNAAYVGRTLHKYIREQVNAARNTPDEEILRHAAFSHSWILAKRFRTAIEGAAILDETKITTETSNPADILRQKIIDLVSAKPKRPWILFRNQSDLFELLEEIMIAYYGSTVPQAIAAKKAERPVKQVSRGRTVPLYNYPKPLFDYLAERAPQIGNLT